VVARSHGVDHRSFAPLPPGRLFWTSAAAKDCFFDRLLSFGDVEGIELEEGLPPVANPSRERIHLGRFDESFQPGKSYLLILMLDVLEHLPKPASALQHVRRLLAPGGVSLATVPAFQLLWTNHDVIHHHFQRYSAMTLRPLIESAKHSVIAS